MLNPTQELEHPENPARIKMPHHAASVQKMYQLVKEIPNKQKCVCVISIVSHGHGIKVQQLLKSIDKNLDPVEFEVHIVVRANIPEHQEISYSSRFRLSHLTNETPRGFGANHNLNYAQVSGDLFVIANPDLVLISLCRLSDISNRPGVYIASPIIHELDGTVADFRRNYPTPQRLIKRRLLGKTDKLTTRENFWFAGVFLVIPSKFFRVLGGFDEGYYMYVEDCDLSWRAAQLGAAFVVVPSWHVQHEAQRISRRALRPLIWHLRSLMRFWCKMTIFWIICFFRSKPQNCKPKQGK